MFCALFSQSEGKEIKNDFYFLPEEYLLKILAYIVLAYYYLLSFVKLSTSFICLYWEK